MSRKEELGLLIDHGQSIAEKILAAHADRDAVRPGEFVVARVDKGVHELEYNYLQELRTR